MTFKKNPKKVYERGVAIATINIYVSYLFALFAVIYGTRRGEFIKTFMAKCNHIDNFCDVIYNLQVFLQISLKMITKHY